MKHQILRYNLVERWLEVCVLWRLGGGGGGGGGVYSVHCELSMYIESMATLCNGTEGWTYIEST